MTLALLGGANPRVCKNGPFVRLHEGTWKVRCEGVVDSQLSLHGVLGKIDSLPKDFVLEGGCCVNVVIDKPGKESHISVFAEQVHGT